MPGLILKLRPHEEVMINGVVVENGDKKTFIRIKTEGAHILRMRDAICAEEATTPLKRAYFAAQRAVSGQMRDLEAAAIVRSALCDARGASLPAALDFEALENHVQRHDFYQVMRKLSPTIIPAIIDAQECAGAASDDARRITDCDPPPPSRARKLLSISAK